MIIVKVQKTIKKNIDKLTQKNSMQRQKLNDLRVYLLILIIMKSIFIYAIVRYMANIFVSL
mgnify:CR=1 FL=1